MIWIIHQSKDGSAKCLCHDSHHSFLESLHTQVWLTLQHCYNETQKVQIPLFMTCLPWKLVRAFSVDFFIQLLTHILSQYMRYLKEMNSVQLISFHCQVHVELFSLPGVSTSTLCKEVGIQVKKDYSLPPKHSVYWVSYMHWQLQYNVIRALIETGRVLGDLWEAAPCFTFPISKILEEVSSQVISRATIRAHSQEITAILEIFVSYLVLFLFIYLVIFELQIHGIDFITDHWAVHP